MSERTQDGDDPRSADLIVSFGRLKQDDPELVLLFARDAGSFVAFAEDAAAVVRSVQGGPFLSEVAYREAGYFSTARFAKPALEGVLAALVAGGRRAAVLERAGTEPPR